MAFDKIQHLYREVTFYSGNGEKFRETHINVSDLYIIDSQLVDSIGGVPILRRLYCVLQYKSMGPVSNDNYNTLQENAPFSIAVRNESCHRIWFILLSCSVL